jgi:ribosome-associated toxin RatA of RatAB toxin-antitoxin module
MNEFEVVTVIGRPVEEVFAVVQDVARTPLWNPGLLEVRRTSEGPLGVGATMIYVGTFLGRRYESPVVCTGFAENNQLATATTGGPFYLEVDQMVVSADAGTKVTIHCRGESRGFFKLAEPVVVRLTKRQVEAAAGNLKALMEERAL